MLFRSLQGGEAMGKLRGKAEQSGADDVVFRAHGPFHVRDRHHETGSAIGLNLRQPSLCNLALAQCLLPAGT